MKQPQPFFRQSKNAWYLQLGRRQISLGKDEKKAWKRYHQIMAANKPLDRETATIEELFERYLEWVQVNRKQGTYRTIRQHLSHCARSIGKKTKVANLCGADLADWVETESTWNSTTRHDAIGSVVRAFNWAVEKRYLRLNPVAHVPNKPSRKRREVVFSGDEWKEIRALVQDQAFGDLLDFMWETGCRPLEARTMEAKHINLDAGIVVFPPSEAKGERTERVIYLTDRAMEICRPRMERFPDGPIMRNSKNGPWTKDAIGCRFKRIRKKLGRAANSYAIRHSYATNGLISGMDSLTLSQLMGHCDVSTLARNYQHLSKNPEYLKAQARSLRA